MRFLNPILHPTKPKRVVAKVASTVLESLKGALKVDWGCILHDLIIDLVAALRSGQKAETPLPAYLAHLYYHHSLLRPKEEKLYSKALEIEMYGGRTIRAGTRRKNRTMMKMSLLWTGGENGNGRSRSSLLPRQHPELYRNPPYQSKTVQQS